MLLLTELRLALRALLRAPGFLALSSGVLALGLAAVVAMSSVLRTTLADPPLPQVDRVRSLLVRDDTRRQPVRWVPIHDVRAWARQQTSFEALGAVTPQTTTVERPDGVSEWCESGLVSLAFFEVLRVRPLLGRVIVPDDTRPGAAPVAVLSERLWRSAFSADPAVIGRSVQVGGEAVTVVGVAPAALDLPPGTRLWVADRTDTERSPRADGPYVEPIGRLRDGVSPEAAGAELHAIHARRARALPEVATELPEVRSLSTLWLGAEYPRLFRVLYASVFLVLLLACVNVAGLMLVRGAGRTHEAAVRRALGASGPRLAGQMMAEAVIIGGLAALLALVLGAAAAEMTRRVMTTAMADARLPSWWSEGLDGADVALGLGTALASTLTGLYPAVRAARVSIEPLLREGTRDTRRHTAGLVRWLVVAEIALSAALLTTAGQVIRAGAALGHGDVGIPTAGFLVGRLDLPQRWGDARAIPLLRALSARLRAVPGVEAAALSSAPPGGSTMWHDMYALSPGRPGPLQELPSAAMVQVDTGFFDTFGIPLRAGRGFLREDVERSRFVAVVSESLARAAWPGRSALGRQLRVAPQHEHPTLTVVGVAADVRFDQRLEALGAPSPTIYLPLEQWTSRWLYLSVRRPRDPLAAADGLRAAVQALAPDLAVYGVHSLDQEREYVAAPLRLIGATFAVFGAVTLLLAASGLYGVLSYSVVQGARELAIRRALGAPDGRIAAAVAARAGWQLLLGLGLGLALAPLVGVALGPALGRAQPALPVYLTVAATISAALAAAVAVPLRRSLRLSPAAFLHEA